MAIFFPNIFLESKGIIDNPAACVWMTEVGILLFSTGIVLFLIRAEKSSKLLKNVFIGNIVIQIGLLIIELKAFNNNVITDINGIIPNSILHIVLTGGLVFYFLQMNKELKILK